MYTLPDLPYDLAALEPHYSAKVLELHHDKHHATYVKGLNDTLEKLDAVRTSGDYSSIVGLQRTLAFNLSGHVLHSIFWENLSPDGGGEPTGELGEAITRDFGSFERFKAHLTQATTTVQGSGWGALAWDSYGDRLYIEQVYDHQDNVGQSGTPLLVLDAWEHAYYLQYLNVRPDYVNAMWNIINWDDVSKRYAAAKS